MPTGESYIHIVGGYVRSIRYNVTITGVNEVVVILLLLLLEKPYEYYILTMAHKNIVISGFTYY